MRSLLAVLAVSGCSTFMHSIERPTAQVRDVTVVPAGTGVTGELRVDVTNPNSFGVPLSGIDWRLTIGGMHAATGSVRLTQTIPARGVAPITTTLSIGIADAIAVANVLASGARDYRIDATLHFSTIVGRVDVAIDHAGVI